jgi:NDP-4-keto-2,6-dideoxyhexose 3-C-methyltransferase
MIKKIKKCRSCGSKKLKTILKLGKQYLTGVFPSNRSTKITYGPLEISKCNSNSKCNLVQLSHKYDFNELYGKNYGYRSGLNKSMSEHLKSKTKYILKKYSFINQKPLIIDIGSNDATTLKTYPKNKYELFGFDPTAKKFKKYYPKYIKYSSNFFSFKLFKKIFKKKRAEIITSFSMFYDLEKPITFMKDVYNTLSDDGIWIFEQSYLPSMIKTMSFDTICQEHLEYYTLHQIQYMCDATNFKIIDIEFNNINGGSFSITVSKKKSKHKEKIKLIDKIIKNEKKNGFVDGSAWKQFNLKIDEVSKKILNFFDKCKNNNKKVMGLGASTKGNVLLQYLKLNKKNILKIGDVNIDKHGKFTPGTNIPIVSEEEVLKNNADYYFILPWHFKSFFLNNKKFKNKKLVFPLPKLQIMDN